MPDKQEKDDRSIDRSKEEALNRGPEGSFWEYEMGSCIHCSEKDHCLDREILQNRLRQFTLDVEKNQDGSSSGMIQVSCKKSASEVKKFWDYEINCRNHCMKRDICQDRKMLRAEMRQLTFDLVKNDDLPKSGYLNAVCWDKDLG